MARKRLTPLQQAYQKEYNRLRKGFSRYRKEGYYFPEESIQKSPKRVTQQMLQNIKQIKPKQLTTVATKVDVETGEITQSEKQKSLKKISTTKVQRISKPKVKEIKIDKPDYGVQLPSKIEEPEPYYGDMFRDDDLDFDVDYFEESYYPSMDIVDAIKDRINELPDVTFRGKGVQIEARKQSLISILDDTLSYYDGEPKALSTFIDYLEEHQQEIFDALDTIKYSSKDEKVDATFAQIGQIFNGGATLSPGQSESLSLMQEMYY